MKLKYFQLLLLSFFIGNYSLEAQDVTTVTAANEDISDNLDLEAVASVFGEAKDLEDFEEKLNDPDTQISNLDLNNDGEVDYLRVMESVKDNVHTISIQAVLGKNEYQEVATIDVQKDSKGETQVQVVGNVNMYGPNYYITPVYPVVPVFFTLFWVAAYRPWYSPWYWGFRPPYFRPWRPYPAYRYRANVHVHVNIHNSYHRTNVSINNRPHTSNTRDNSYFKNNPDKSFDKRNPGASNRSDLTKNRKPTTNKKDYKSTGRPVNKPSTKPATSKPSTRPSTSKPSTKPATSRPTSRPSTSKASARPTSRPSNSSSYSRPTSRPSNSSSHARPSGGASRSYSRQAPSRSSVRRTRH